jgi:hypothetical protein
MIELYQLKEKKQIHNHDSSEGNLLVTLCIKANMKSGGRQVSMKATSWRVISKVPTVAARVRARV